MSIFRVKILVLSFLIGLILPSSKVFAFDRISDSLSLVNIFKNTKGKNWKKNSRWLSRKPINKWYGITLKNGRVSKINLSFNGLDGTIPKEIGNLSELEELYLGNNKLSGTLPKEIGNLKKLEQLCLEVNELSGKIPKEIKEMTALSRVYLYQNKFTDPLPSSFGNLFSDIEEL